MVSASFILKTLEILIVVIYFFGFTETNSLSVPEPNSGINSKDKVCSHDCDPDIGKNVSFLITSKGYPLENHTVITDDGFILLMHRIPHGRNESNVTCKKEVVFVQHGILSSSAHFVLNFPNQSLGFVLADAGYDVWLGNTRGNTYSRQHVIYSPNSDEFWNYSFNEMAKYDLPAMMDYILKNTGKEKIFYIAHSQGTTATFAMLSENKKYNDKIKLFVALGPVAMIGHTTSAVRYIAPFTEEIYLLTGVLGIREFRPNKALMKILGENVCESEIKMVCENVMCLLLGYDKYQINETRLGVYFEYIPSETSVKSAAHYGQMINSKKFRKYDYSPNNFLRYGQDSPPEYDVSKITAPVVLMYAEKDKFADLTDVQWLKKKLTSLVEFYKVPFAEFSHMDFLIAIDAKRLVYDKILTFFSNYAGKYPC